MARLTGLVVLFSLVVISLSTGLWNGVLNELAKVPQPLSQIGMGGIRGMLDQAEAVERFVCDRDGNCERRGGQ